MKTYINHINVERHVLNRNLVKQLSKVAHGINYLEILTTENIIIIVVGLLEFFLRENKTHVKVIF
jgi:CRISPR-associated DxTHG motif protein